MTEERYNLLPDILKHDIEEAKKAYDRDDISIDLYQDECYGSINMALMARCITNEEAEYLRDIYVRGGYWNNKN